MYPTDRKGLLIEFYKIELNLIVAGDFKRLDMKKIRTQKFIIE